MDEGRTTHSEKRHSRLALLFDFGLIVKVVAGTAELIGAVLIAYVPPSLVLRVADILTQGELAQDPNDAVANSLLALAQTFSLSDHTLIIVYLALRGGIKLVLASLILLGQTFAYPLFMLFLAVFALYEGYRSVTTGSILLLAFMCFDLGLLALTVYRYRQVHATIT